MSKKHKSLKVAEGRALSEDAGCYIGYFPGGPPPPAALESDVSGLHFQCLSNSSRRKNKQRILVGETQKMQYIGTNFGKEHPRSIPCKFAVGVVNAKDKTVQLVEMEHVYRLQSQLLGTAHDLNDEEVKAELTYAEKMEKKKLLVETFGSKKSKSALRAAAANVIDVKNVSEANAIAKSVVDTVAKDDKPLAAAGLETALPPHNSDAQSPEEAYPLDELFTPEDRGLLDVTPFLEASKSTKAIANLRKDGQVYAWVLERLAVLRTIHEKAEWVRVAGVLMYMNHLIHFASLPKIIKFGVDKLAEQLGASSVLVRKLLSRFCIAEQNDKGNTVYKRPSSMVDRLVNWIFALCLHVDKFKSLPDLLAQDLKVTAMRAALYFRAMGCKVEKSRKRKAEGEEVAASADAVPAGALVVTLPLPLTFPKPKAPIRNKQK